MTSRQPWRWLALVLATVVAAACASPRLQPHPETGDRWVLMGSRVYVAPDLPPMDDAWVLVEGGKISAVGLTSRVWPQDVLRTSICSGRVITAGFQDSHVHFTDAAFANAATLTADQLADSLEAMLTGFGFTTAVDTGSDIANTSALRRRIEQGEVRGPRILTTGVPLYPRDGIPFYLRDLPPDLLQQLPQPAGAEEAIGLVRGNFARGADATKLFIATPQAGGEIRRMSAEVARAAVSETHARGALVMAHPTDAEGVGDAVRAGVDILVHTTIDPPKYVWSDIAISDMVALGMSVVPTLKLWRFELAKTKLPADIQELAVTDAIKQLSAFSKAGGQVLFGTDVGYMTDFDPADEYVLMAQAGLTPMQILASLTTAPARRWNEGGRRGRVRPGLDADLVVLNGDPAADVRHFANVKCTIRGGREIFVRTGSGPAWKQSAAGSQQSR